MSLDSPERRLADLGLHLPPEAVVPPELATPFAWVRVVGTRVFVSGHGALDSQGRPRGPFGPVPTTVSVADAQASAAAATLAAIGSLKRTVGDLDRLTWLQVQCFVNAEPGFAATTVVANAASAMILDVFGTGRGSHARFAPGVPALPLNLPVVVGGELVLDA